jgi:hypothetical protein
MSASCVPSRHQIRRLQGRVGADLRWGAFGEDAAEVEDGDPSGVRRG